MTKEDEALVRETRDIIGRGQGSHREATLLRLLDEAMAERDSWRRVLETMTAERDEQAARVAELETQLQAVHYVFERGGDFQLGPKGRHRGLAERIAAAVAPGESKP